MHSPIHTDTNIIKIDNGSLTLFHYLNFHFQFIFFGVYFMFMTYGNESSHLLIFASLLFSIFFLYCAPLFQLIVCFIFCVGVNQLTCRKTKTIIHRVCCGQIGLVYGRF